MSDFPRRKASDPDWVEMLDRGGDMRAERFDALPNGWTKDEILHIPPDYVVDRCAADGESRSHRDFLFRPYVWTRCRRQISERITSVISKACHFTTKSFMKTCVFTPT